VVTAASELGPRQRRDAWGSWPNGDLDVLVIGGGARTAARAAGRCPSGRCPAGRARRPPPQDRV